MEIVEREEGHNRVDWERRTPVVWIEVGILVGAISFAALIITSPSPMRWYLIGAVTGVLLVIAVLIAMTTPLIDAGYLERLPEGGVVQRWKVWLGLGNRPQFDLALDDVTRFEMETQLFEDSPHETYVLSRVWAVLESGKRRALTAWIPPEIGQQLGEALARAGRRAFEAPH
ncbi:MAG: hypothetical protein ACP5JG_11895 [Anaerolineae bacterium]